MARRKRNAYYTCTVLIFSIYLFLKMQIFQQSSTSDTSEAIDYFVIQDSHKSADRVNHTQHQFRSDCRRLLEGDREEILYAKSRVKMTKPKFISDHAFGELTSNCDTFKRTRGYVLNSLEEEEQFPIAFSILLYKDVHQTERLLRAIYRPQNTYCIHVDAKSSETVHIAIRNIAKCFDNVFIASKLERVIYAGFSRLKAEINCMHDSYKRPEQWKYYINLPSQEFPLKTNYEMVQILKLYNGANDIEGITGRRLSGIAYRFRYHWDIQEKNGKRIYNNTRILKSKPPNNITIIRGSAYGIFSRQFVRFILINPSAKALLEWSRDTYSPDEYYWATLNFLKYNPHLNTPGGYDGVPDSKPWLAVWAAWKGVDKCYGKWQRGICVFGVGDLQFMVERKELFVNKFLYDYEPLALECAEEWLRYKQMAVLPIDLSYYRNLTFLRKEKNL
ncbi:beta-1,3-galactosyl-O-glycosyl-glycoprotein beta-1,6-N-acetylglucosaminyltransferase isoform X1 [Lingula anatina]|uniref:Beta-1,3-galactosyl-O-glycosyl-glycoprotein beta-1,6-N-acetylglucosaminyltransferase isoform X1 n=2 Tax=Lingula anatina TaxID=7574 RepID=A0A1S3HGK0_LINAN|nr:beta-1,3-galactosyl-O-glycosyl-glycoprotein beta-1,6-N-acetylglucosaminyltransferase isoform X1 [Lingula anatina]XP_013385196.1 beta-1,3-galactosyl-O-glycosyl-glycoprotein beta-1,6-N-acetylglucosaminyltransferase isoform X1 [Lingula anatina]|eukprot:XP_013385195.1 beta-1,3-galactosyl-O-glycosyl-glycoprotein beta-1,6-N-acetylglucosaminyltransferase isoform X1 [Lingula anatina]